jgi:hypothetical protein
MPTISLSMLAILTRRMSPPSLTRYGQAIPHLPPNDVVPEGACNRMNYLGMAHIVGNDWGRDAGEGVSSSAISAPVPTAFRVETVRLGLRHLDPSPQLSRPLNASSSSGIPSGVLTPLLLLP